MRNSRESGFTLIELMVSVLIVAILLAAAIPTFLGARRHAQDLQASSASRNTVTTIAAVMADARGPQGDPLTVLAAAEPAYTYTYGVSTQPKEVSIAVFAGEIQLAGFDVGDVRPQVIQTAWLVVTATRSKSGACAIGVTHERAGSFTYVTDRMKECRASLADPNDFASFLKEAGHVGGWTMLFGPGCEQGCNSDGGTKPPEPPAGDWTTIGDYDASKAAWYEATKAACGTDPACWAAAEQKFVDHWSTKSDPPAEPPADTTSTSKPPEPPDDKTDTGDGSATFDPGKAAEQWSKKDPRRAKQQWYRTARKACGKETDSTCWRDAYRYWEKYYDRYFGDR